MASKDLEWFYSYGATKDWVEYKGLKRSTYISYYHCIMAYCIFREKNPDELKEEVESLSKDAVNIICRHIIDFQNHIKSQKAPDGTDYADGTILAYKNAVQSFYAFLFGHKISVPKLANAKRKKRQEYIPGRLELREILECCDLQAKTIILFQATTGLRVSDLRRLKIRDVEKVFEDGAEFLALHYIPLKTEGSTGERTTVVPPCTISYLKKYLALRQQNGEEIKPGSVLFGSRSIKGNAISDTQINNMIKAAVKKSGILTDMQMQDDVSITNKKLRSYFSNCFSHSEMKKDYYEYMMGHAFDKYNGAYWKVSDEQLIEVYRKNLRYIDPFFDEEKEAMKSENESLSEKVSQLEGRMEKMENDRISKELNNSLSIFGNGEKDVALISDESKIAELLIEGWTVFPLTRKKFMIVRSKEAST